MELLVHSKVVQAVFRSFSQGKSRGITRKTTLSNASTHLALLQGEGAPSKPRQNLG
jgi:hypothetical protein